MLLSTLIKKLKIVNLDGNLINVNDIVSVEFTNDHVVTIEEVSGEVEVNDKMVDVGTRDFLLTSKESFNTSEKLAIVTRDGLKYQIGVTDPIPIVAPQYPASQYHPGSESYTRDYMLIGDYYMAREYWSLAKFALSSGYRTALSVAAALLLYWATMSLIGEKVRVVGILAATVNLFVVAYLLVQLLKLRAGCRWGVLIVLAVDVVAATAVAWYSFFADRRKRYIKIPTGKK